MKIACVSRCENCDLKHKKGKHNLIDLSLRGSLRGYKYGYKNASTITSAIAIISACIPRYVVRAVPADLGSIGFIASNIIMGAVANKLRSSPLLFLTAFSTGLNLTIPIYSAFGAAFNENRIASLGIAMGVLGIHLITEVDPLKILAPTAALGAFFHTFIVEGSDAAARQACGVAIVGALGYWAGRTSVVRQGVGVLSGCFTLVHNFCWFFFSEGAEFLGKKLDL